VSEHYCPAGKCECDNRENGLCRTPCSAFYDGINKEWEVCPWPSRQKRIDGVKGESWRGVFSPELEKSIERLLAMGERMKRGENEYAACYAAGLVHQAKVDREAVNKSALSYIPLFRACQNGEEAETVMMAHNASIRRNLAAVAPEEGK